MIQKELNSEIGQFETRAPEQAATPETRTESGQLPVSNLRIDQN